MKKQVCILLFIFTVLSFATCVSGQNIQKYFEIDIEQDGKLIPIENHQVILRKKAFTIIFYFQQPEGILINAAFSPESFESAQAGKPLEDIIGFYDLGMAEEAFNPRAMIMIASRSPHFWYYANDAEHRFNNVVKKGGLLICKRIVANVMFRDTTKEILPVRNIPENELYLVFMRTEWTKNYSQQIEKQREYLKVIFQ